jgi:hypothetical protein
MPTPPPRSSPARFPCREVGKTCHHDEEREASQRQVGIDDPLNETASSASSHFFFCLNDLCSSNGDLKRAI